MGLCFAILCGQVHDEIMKNTGKLATLLALTILVSLESAATKTKVTTVKAGPPSDWKTARVTDVRFVARDTDVGRAIKEDPRNIVDRRIYSIDNGEKVLQLDDLDYRFNHKAFQKPC